MTNLRLSLLARIKEFFAGRPRQITFCYCKRCGNELCADPDTSCEDLGDGTVRYKCGVCGEPMRFLFDAPVPIYIPTKEQNTAEYWEKRR